MVNVGYISRYSWLIVDDRWLKLVNSWLMLAIIGYSWPNDIPLNHHPSLNSEAGNREGFAQGVNKASEVQNSVTGCI